MTTMSDDRVTALRSTRPRAAFRPALRALRTELRRGIAPWTGVCTAVVLAVPMVNKAETWQGDWGETQGYLHSVATLLAGPLVAAAACWAGAREHRRGTAELWLSTPLPRSSQVLVAALPVTLWAVAGYLAALAASLVATWPYAGGGSPFVSLAVVDAAVLVAMGLVGFVVGQRCRWRLAAPVLAVLLYLALGVPNYAESSAQYLDPAMQYMLSRSLPVWWFAPAMVAWTCGLALTVLIAHAARRRFLAVVPLVVAAAVAPLIVHTGPGLIRDDPAAGRLVCADGAPQVCLTEYDRSLLPQVSRALAGLFGRLEGVPGAPARYANRQPRHGTDEVWVPTPDVGWYVLRGRLRHPDDFAWQVAHMVVVRECPDYPQGDLPSGGDRLTATDDAVTQWLAGPQPQRPFSAEKTPQHRRLAAMPDPERRAWLGRFLTTRASCTPAEVPVL